MALEYTNLRMGYYSIREAYVKFFTCYKLGFATKIN